MKLHARIHKLTIAWTVLAIFTPSIQSLAAESLIVEYHADEIVIRNDSSFELTDQEAILQAATAENHDLKLPYAGLVLQAAQMTAVDPVLIHAIMAVESGHNTKAISPRGARGLMQLMPDTARELGVVDPHDPTQSIVAGARHLGKLLHMFNQDLTLALAAYNAGAGAVQRYGSRIPPYAETMTFVPRVLAKYRGLQTRKL